MTQYRRMDKRTTREFFKICRRGFEKFNNSFLYVVEFSNYQLDRPTNSLFTGELDIVLYAGIPDPVKELLYAAIREGLLENTPRDEKLRQLCIKDKLKSRRDKRLVNRGRLFGATLLHSIGLKDALKPFKEIVYDDSV